MKKLLLLLLSCFVSFSSSLNAQKLLPKPSQFKSRDLPREHKNISKNSNTQNIPYPIIFIHGLNSNSSTWDEFKLELMQNGLNFGGYIDFCLNNDDNNYSTNKLVWPESDADIRYFPDSEYGFNVGDIYFLNFDIDNNGNLWFEDDLFDEKLSNQSAIAKQGVAVGKAIEMILAKTGRDKVILLGHSMGGLAAREYLQNTDNWQSDGLPHVAKLVTTGTPHGGSNALGGQVFGIDYKSEAIRDLKKSSVFLEGGFESDVSSDYYNNDVNCNGFENDIFSLTGLNYRDYFSDIDYSCVIGTALSIGGLGGDGAVTVNSANWNNANPGYSDLTENIFEGVLTHLELTSNTKTLMEALDEPKYFDLSYEVFVHEQYKGFMTMQFDGYDLDYDAYELNINDSGFYDFTIQNPYNTDLTFTIYDANFNIIALNNLSDYSTDKITVNLDASLGPYFLDFFSLASAYDDNNLKSYSFLIEENTLANNNSFIVDNFKLFPNPTNNKISFNNTKINFETLEIYNVYGQLISKINLLNLRAQNVDMSNFNKGIYNFKFGRKELVKIVKVIKI